MKVLIAISFFLGFVFQPIAQAASVGILHLSSFGAPFNTDKSNAMKNIVQLAGHTGTIITDFSNFNLSSVDILWFIDGDNTGAESSFINRGADVRSFISSGGYLVMQNRSGDSSETYLSTLGTSGTSAESYGDDVSFVDSGFVSNGPNGLLNNSSLDNGGFTYHSYVDSSSVSGLDGYRPILANAANNAEVISFYFKSGPGGVYFDTTPGNTFLYYSTDGSSPQTIYLTNVLDVTSSLIPEPSAVSLLVLGAGVLAVIRRRKKD